jgi:hypothetical protein
MDLCPIQLRIRPIHIRCCAPQYSVLAILIHSGLRTPSCSSTSLTFFNRLDFCELYLPIFITLKIKQKLKICVVNLFKNNSIITFNEKYVSIIYLSSTCLSIYLSIYHLSLWYWGFELRASHLLAGAPPLNSCLQPMTMYFKTKGTLFYIFFCKFL